MQLLFRALKNWALQVHVAKDNSILGDVHSGSGWEKILHIFILGVYFVVVFYLFYDYYYLKKMLTTASEKENRLRAFSLRGYVVTRYAFY